MNKSVNPFNNSELSPKELFKKLKAYYENNSLYEDLQYSAFVNNTWIEAIKPLRTVVNRSVEFYVSKLLPGDLSQIKISANAREVESAIEQVWTWSNFSSQKQLAVRNLALYGNLFWKVETDGKKVYFEIIEPKFVTDFKTDSRGYITEIRLDVPIDKDLTHTEFWNKEYYSVWEHYLGDNASLEQLGDAKDFGWLAELGIDFVPFVHVKFRETGEKYGKACVQHALDKIDEANRESTRLAQLLFRYNKPTIVVSANDKDSQGKPIPAPKIKPSENDLNLSDSSVIYLPGVSTINSLVPQLDYEAARNIVKDMEQELEKDLPELRYYSLTSNDLSGKALRTILAGAVDRAEEARSNFIQGLYRLNQMALTIGSFWNLWNVGTYENGGFEHSINSPEMFGSTLEEKASTLKELISAGMPLASAMKFIGFSEEEIKETLASKQTEDQNRVNLQNQSLASAMNSFNGG